MNPNNQNTKKQFRNGTERERKENAYDKQYPTIQVGTKVKNPYCFPTSSPKKCKTKTNTHTQNPSGISQISVKTTLF